MSRPKGIAETSPRKPGGGGKRENAGRKREATYLERLQADDASTSVIRLPNRTLAEFERVATEQGMSVKEYLIRAAIANQFL